MMEFVSCLGFLRARLRQSICMSVGVALLPTGHCSPLARSPNHTVFPNMYWMRKPQKFLLLSIILRFPFLSGAGDFCTCSISNRRPGRPLDRILAPPPPPPHNLFPLSNPRAFPIPGRRTGCSSSAEEATKRSQILNGATSLQV